MKIEVKLSKIIKGTKGSEGNEKDENIGYLGKNCFKVHDLIARKCLYETQYYEKTYSESYFTEYKNVISQTLSYLF